MPFDTGIFNDLSDANSIADPMVLVRASAIQLPKNLGTFWEDCQTKEDPESNRKFTIYSRTETPRSGTVGTGGWDGVATTGLPVADASGLIRGLVLNVDGEYVVVTEVDTSVTPNTISVRERGTAGTTAAAHLVDVAYTVVGSAIDDVDLKNVTSVSEITNLYENYMQTVAEPIDYTRGGILDPRKGLTENQIAMQEEEALIRVAKNVYASSIYGRKQQKTTNKPWMTAGLLQQLTDSTGGRLVLTYAVNGVLTEAALRAALRILVERGNPTTIYCSSANKDTINEFLYSAPTASKLVVNTTKDETQAGYYVETYNYEGTIIEVKIDTNMPDDQIAIMNMSKCWKGWKKGDELQNEGQTTLSSRESRSAYNGSFFVAIEEVGYEHMLLTGITQE